MVSKQLAFAAAGLCFSLLPAALADDAKGPVRSGAEQLPEVKIYRLHRADAASLAKEFSVILGPTAVRLVPYERTNSLVVAAPPEIQKAMARLISRLDVPQAGREAPLASDQTVRSDGAATGKSGVRRTAPRVSSPGEPANEGNTFAVVRASPQLQQAMTGLFSPPDGAASVVESASGQTQRAVEALGSQTGGPQVRAQPAAGNQPATGDRPSAITVLRVPSGDIAGLAQALSLVRASTARGDFRVKSVVITPSTGPVEEAEKPDRPRDTQRR